ncbi:MAG TPA: helicase-associated domain-containing protein [Chthonomonadaceae bacterium]|nr:helicase-associated domain-containing protein [Chthonomonadaceae bacterium]
MATFAEALYDLSSDRLRAIAERRKLDSRRLAAAHDKRQLAQIMAVELNYSTSTGAAIIECNARELRLLQIIASVGGRREASWDGVVEAAGGQPLAHAVESAYEGLETLGLAIRAGRTVMVGDTVRAQIPMSLSDHYTLATCLNAYDAPAVARIAGRLGLMCGTKAQNLKAVSERLMEVMRGDTSEIELDPEERAIVDYLVNSGGSASAIETAGAVLGKTDDFFRFDWHNRWKLGRSRNAVDRLLEAGLVFAVTYGYGYDLTLVIPGDLLRYLAGQSMDDFWLGAVASPQSLAETPAVTRRHAGLVRDVVVFFGYISTQDSPRTNTGSIHKNSLKTAARQLTLPDERYAAFLYSLCRRSGLIAPQSDRNIYAVTAKGEAWLGLDPISQVRLLSEDWRHGASWAEVFDEPMRRRPGLAEGDGASLIREAVLSMLASRADNEFVDIESIAAAMAFEHPLQFLASAAIESGAGDSPGDFVRAVAADSLYWLGAAELGWTGEAATPAEKSAAPSRRSHRTEETSGRPAPPEALRLTPLGAHLFAGGPAPELPPAETQFIVQANNEIFVPPYLESRTLFRLLAIAEPPGKSAAGGVVSLTRESIRRALDHGISSSEMLAFLRSHSKIGIPQNVEYLISEVAGRHGHIHIGRAVMYLKVDSPLVLTELQSRRELKGYFVRALDDTVAILHAVEPEKLLRELRKAGYLPINDDAPAGHGIRLAGEPPGYEWDRSARAPARRRGAEPPPPTVDWDRFARAEVLSQREAVTATPPGVRPSEAIRNKEEIRNLLVQSVPRRAQVEIAYADGPGREAVARIVEPKRVMAGYVIVYQLEVGRDDTVPINKIEWARQIGGGSAGR